MEYKPILISELVKQYKEDIEKKRGFFEKIVSNTKTNIVNSYDNILQNINNKMNKTYTQEDLILKENMNPYEMKIKEYGIFLGNFITNSVIDGVDGVILLKDNTINFLNMSKNCEINTD